MICLLIITRAVISESVRLGVDECFIGVCSSREGQGILALVLRDRFLMYGEIGKSYDQ